MSYYQAKTVSVLNNGEPTWTSPDGSRKAYRIVMDVNGKENTLETYSEVIAQQDWHGMVEIYEKNKRYYVRQAPKDNFGAPSQAQGLASHNERTTPKVTTGSIDSSHTMYTSYAKDIAVAMIAAGKLTGDYDDIIGKVSEAGIRMYQNRPGGEGVKTQSEPLPTAPPDLDDNTPPWMREE